MRDGGHVKTKRFIWRHSLNYVGWKQRKEVAANLKTIYTAATEAQAEQRLAEFSLKWDAKFPTIAKSWLRNMAKKWTMSVHDWKAALNRFAIVCENRLPVE